MGYISMYTVMILFMEVAVLFTNVAPQEKVFIEELDVTDQPPHPSCTRIMRMIIKEKLKR